MSFPPSVSILFLVKNERARLEDNGQRIAGQDYSAPVEIIAVDSGSGDGTPDFLREHGAHVIEIPPASFHHAATRNLAAERAQHDVLVLLSGDAVPLDDQWLAALTAPFADPEVAAVYGRQVPPKDVGAVRARYMAGEYPGTQQLRRRVDSQSIHPGLFRFSDANGAVRREDWARHRWNEEVLVAEDIGLCRDLFMEGRAIAYAPGAAVLHGHKRNLISEFRYAFDNGLSLRQLDILGNPAYAGAAAHALRRMAGDLRHFLSRGDVPHACQALAVYAAKWAGVQAGQRGGALPKAWLRHLSEHTRRRVKAGLE